MFDLFRRKEDQADPETNSEQQAQSYTAPGTQIRFDPELIGKLKADHQAVVALYGRIQAAFNDKDYPAVSQMLNEFRTALQGHLLTENVRLYIYLDHQLRSDETNAELIHGFRREMDAIAKTAMNFLKKYEAIGVDADLATSFARDFAAIGEVLTTRIEKEESVLYPLYLASY